MNLFWFQFKFPWYLFPTKLLPSFIPFGNKHSSVYDFLYFLDFCYQIEIDAFADYRVIPISFRIETNQCIHSDAKDFREESGRESYSWEKIVYLIRFLKDLHTITWKMTKKFGWVSKENLWYWLILMRATFFSLEMALFSTVIHK